jgi:hypothetical protein
MDLKLEKYTPYHLNYGVLNELVFELKVFGDGIEESQDLPVSETLELFFEKGIKDLEVNYHCDKFELTCEGNNYQFHLKEEDQVSSQIIAESLKLIDLKIYPFSSTWYFYDVDECTEDGQCCYCFFITNKYDIVKESVKISDYYPGRVKTNILEMSSPAKDYKTGNMCLWLKLPETVMAEAQWFFKKFYTETCEGQIIAMRDAIIPTNTFIITFVALKKFIIKVTFWALVAIALIHHFL